MTTSDAPRSYDYALREGVRRLSWEDVAMLARSLAESLQPRGIEAVVGIARAGLFPATTVACALRLDLHPVRVTRRERDVVTYPHPLWKVPVPAEVDGRSIAVVDEIADTGETLALVAEAVRQAGARTVTTAALVAHSWANPAPDIVALVSDEFVVFPWDERVLIDGIWRAHPEIEAALRAQGIEPADS